MELFNPVLKLHNPFVDPFRTHRFAEQKSRPDIAAEFAEHSKICVRQNTDRGRLDSKIVRHLEKGLANIGVADVGCAVLDQ